VWRSRCLEEVWRLIVPTPIQSCTHAATLRDVFFSRADHYHSIADSMTAAGLRSRALQSPQLSREATMRLRIQRAGWIASRQRNRKLKAPNQRSQTWIPALPILPASHGTRESL
jgi:hypothetical protein